MSKLAAPGRLRDSWAELEVGPGGKLGRNCSCRARLTLKLRMRTARAALAQINSVCSARISRAGPSRSPVAAGATALYLEALFLTTETDT